MKVSRKEELKSKDVRLKKYEDGGVGKRIMEGKGREGQKVEIKEEAVK